MEARIIKETEDLTLIEWSDPKIGFGRLDFIYNGDGTYKVDAETMSVKTIVRILKALEPTPQPSQPLGADHLQGEPEPPLVDKESEYFHWVFELPKLPGKYIIRTKSQMDNIHHFEARFNGKAFDISNQEFVAYLSSYQEIAELKRQIEELKK